MNRSPAFQFYPDKWQSHTRRLSDSSYRVFHELVCWMWQHSPDYCSIQASAEAVACAIAMPLETVRTALADINNAFAPLLKTEGDRWICNGLRKEAAKQEHRSSVARNRASSRWANATASENHATASTPTRRDAVASPQHCTNDAIASKKYATASENDAVASPQQCFPSPSPTPYIMSHEQVVTETNKKPVPDSKLRKKGDWKDEAREQARAASLVAIPLDVMASATIPALWREWCDHRSELAVRDKRKPWTVRAATNEMNSIAHAIEEHGEEPVAMQMRAAMAGLWQGLNLQNMRPSYARAGSKQMDKAHQQPMGI